MEPSLRRAALDSQMKRRVCHFARSINGIRIQSIAVEIIAGSIKMENQQIKTLEQQLAASMRLQHLLGEPLYSLAPIGSEYPSGRGSAQAYRLNDRLTVLVKTCDPGETVLLEREKAAYDALVGVRGVPICHGYVPGALVLEFVPDAVPLSLTRCNSERMAMLHDFLHRLGTIDRSTSGQLRIPLLNQVCPSGVGAVGDSDVVRRYANNPERLRNSFIESTASVSDGSFPVHRVHGDFYMANILVNSEHLYFVDLEMSSVSDPVTDFARFFRELFQFVFQSGDLATAVSVFSHMLDCLRILHGPKALERLPFWLSLRLLNGAGHFERIRSMLNAILTTGTVDVRTHRRELRQAVRGMGQFFPRASALGMLDAAVAGGQMTEELRQALEVRRDFAQLFAAFNVKTGEMVLSRQGVDVTCLDAVEAVARSLSAPYMEIALKRERSLSLHVGDSRLSAMLSCENGYDLEAMGNASPLLKVRSRFSLRMQRPTEIILPTREGEILKHPVARLDDDRPYSISIGGTASAALIVLQRGDTGLVVASLQQPPRVNRIRLSRRDDVVVVDLIPDDANSRMELLLLPYIGYWQSALRRLRPLLNNGEYHSRLKKGFRLLFKLGVIDPSGACAATSYLDLVPAAENIARCFGKGHFLHLYGWHACGHDNFYPDYFPSDAMGGECALKAAINAIRETGCLVSLYLNARLADLRYLSRHLRMNEAVVRQPNGDPVIERYHGIDSAVMHPSSSLWQQILSEAAERCTQYGADFIQLDQIGYQRAFGHTWINGNQSLIENIRRRLPETGIWIERVSSVYQGVDFFQANGGGKALMRWADGENRSGQLGDYCPELWATLFPERPFSLHVNSTVDVEKSRALGASIGDVSGSTLGYIDDNTSKKIQHFADRVALKAIQ